MIKKVLSVIVSATMALSLSPISAFAAQPAQTDDTFHYVALGDSIAAGYGITDGAVLDSDPALVLRTEKDGVVDEVASAEDGHNLVPITNAYPYLFYQNTLLQQGAAAGVDVSFANLSSVAFRASDVSKTILTTSNDPYEYAEQAANILDTFVSEGASARLSNHPAIYRKYLSEADLVSVQLGGNDLTMGVIGEMMALDNPIMNSFILSLELMLFGYDADKAALYGISQLAQADITLDDVVEAVKFLNTDNMNEIAVRVEDDAISNVTDVLDAVDEVGNSDVQIALLNMYNPYGNSLEYGADDYSELASKLIKATLAKVTSNLDLSLESSDETPQVVAEAESDSVITTEEATAITDDMQYEVSSVCDSWERLEEIANDLDVSSYTLLSMPKAANVLIAVRAGYNLPDAKEIAAEVKSLKKDIAESLSTIKQEIVYPIQYLLVGRSVDGNIQTLNADLAQLASERDNVTLVDVYDIPNECNTDPHPDANGHAAIAELMGTQLQDLLDSLLPAKSNAVTSFATRLYTEVLDRQPDESGLAAQVAAINAGTASAKIAANFFTSAEYQAKAESSEQTVCRIYRAMFGREADESGLANWKSYLDAGMSIRAVVAGFSKCAEYKTYCASMGVSDASIGVTESRDTNVGVTGFCSRLYSQVLNRAADVSGLNNWCSQLIGGTSCAQVAWGFFGSKEFASLGLDDSTVVKTCYRTLLGREAESDAVVTSWSNALQAQGLQAVVNGFCASREFAAICANYGMTA